MENQVATQKIDVFQYILKQVSAWCEKESGSDVLFKSYSRLTAQKMLFFVASVKYGEEEDQDLLDIFDNFVAMNYGPVEVDIYQAMKDDDLTKYKFKEIKIQIDSTVKLNPEGNYQKRVDQAILALKKINSKIATYHAFELVEISHQWDCWISAMDIASIFNKGSEEITTTQIRNSNQYFGA